MNLSNVNKTNPHLILDLAQCAVSLNERLLKVIREYQQASLKASDQTKGIDIRAMSRGYQKGQYYFMFIASQAHEDVLRVRKNNWLLRAFFLPSFTSMCKTFGYERP